MSKDETINVSPDQVTDPPLTLQELLGREPLDGTVMAEIRQIARENSGYPDWVVPGLLPMSWGMVKALVRMPKFTREHYNPDHPHATGLGGTEEREQAERDLRRYLGTDEGEQEMRDAARVYRRGLTGDKP